MNITEAAFNRIAKLFEVEEDLTPEHSLRVYVQGGGCSGFQYGFSIEENVTNDDMVFEDHGVRVVIDPMSYTYLQEATLDFKTDLNGDMFVINNPNAQTTCGCGSSFSA